MNHFPFSTYLTTNTGLEAEAVNDIIANQKKQHVEKGKFLLREGEICSQSFYVEKGLLRYYSIDNKGKEHIIQFAPEGWFVGDRESQFFNRPSQFFIQALEDSDVAMIDEQLICTISNADEAFGLFTNHLLHNHIRQLQHRINMLLGATAEERYLDFIKIYPDILLRVPQILVASYLGITPESLSRVRKDLAAKNFKI
ncbi:Crp/Fnr family transcriptional regulator [Parafilimonas terrae]|uniref:cAMP-binding domain of CRP or a regulatory subunit of cAMP-dependent protein kinases n=1 Tax=Parafilimonas terrae TaxID=1465490 RepID=A0A1I5V934_9BACT|nr:Crp/Fnr family transcriptional regulator [Parafilimonas terrae]SFQ04048.1 cAMP-binding domain of CRP or a regulatory subunit of cAMP-dependent protein kinases [Parafilimonas terrae]